MRLSALDGLDARAKARTPLKEVNVPHTLQMETACLSPSNDSYVAEQDKVRRSYDRLTPHDGEWLRISISNPADPMVRPGYLERLHRSIFEIFRPWFEGKESHSAFSFEDVIKQMHVMMVSGNGTDKFPSYSGNTALAHGLGKPQIEAGRFRDEIGGEAHSMYRVNFSYRADIKIPHQESERLKNLMGSYLSDHNPKRQLPKQDEPEEEFTLNTFIGPYASIDTIELPRTNSKARAWNRIYGHTISHYYPANGELLEIRRAMTEIMNELKSLPQSERSSQEHALDLLSEYVYLGIHAHLFQSVNFSIIMSQANYILSRFSLKGISTGNLDWIGLSEQFPEFKAVLIEKVKAENPHLFIHPHSLKRSPYLSLIADLPSLGFVPFYEGEVIENKETLEEIRDLMITPALPNGLILQISHDPTEQDSSWMRVRDFTNTDAQSSLPGIAIKITGDAAKQYEIHYMVRLGKKWFPSCKNGEYCGSKDRLSAMTGLKIWITSK